MILERMKRNRYSTEAKIYNRDGTLKRRFEILEWMCDYADEHSGNSPSTNTIAKQFGISQPAVYHHMRLLETHGYVSFVDYNWIIHKSQWIRPELDL